MVCPGGHGRESGGVVAVEPDRPGRECIERRRSNRRISVCAYVVPAKSVRDYPDDIHRGGSYVMRLHVYHNSPEAGRPANRSGHEAASRTHSGPLSHVLPAPAGSVRRQPPVPRKPGYMSHPGVWGQGYCYCCRDVVFPAKAGIHVASPVSYARELAQEFNPWAEVKPAVPKSWGYVDSGFRRKDGRDAGIPTGPYDVAHLPERWATRSSSFIIPAGSSGMTRGSWRYSTK